MSDQLIFDHEKLDVYQIELAFIAWVSPLLSETRSAAQGFYREVCDQLDRASLSFLLNTARETANVRESNAQSFSMMREDQLWSVPRVLTRS
ncbi:MAG TPA: hypothetical protein VJK31_02225 [Chthoniobacterales bacterium]|jgi:hypothetical protein|nr:hypothetical protein [Chthoniobacterales bacterium]